MSVRQSRTWQRLAVASFAAGLSVLGGASLQPTYVLAQTVSEDASKKDPAEARKDVIAGVKAFEKGKMDQAIAELTKGLKSGGLAPKDTAKALYYRGLANRRSGRPAQAISDLTSAVWLKEGLTETERKTALENRSAAYGEAGLKDPGMVEAKGAADSGTTVSSQSSSGSGSSTTVSSSSGSSSNPLSGVGDFFSGLFGGGSSSSANASPSASDTPPASGLETASTGPSVSAWDSTTQKSTGATPTPPPTQQWQTAARPTKQAAVAPPSKAAAPTKKLKGRYEVQVAAVRSRDEAERLALELSKKHASILGARVPEIEETVFGNMGTFYRISIGPFAKADDTASVCKALKAGGYDCMVAKN
ncbi:SPOR domain-containing protein [Filomicrobium sp.]|uniref:SPOR domain-containing protein n=1 Tax=Filomicrobium sp. TaxID=2024831 RepID=UPI002588AB43|nr:SPOR domain-containing protein [Filomicrobium sp.]MCV0371406.1 SPOR domain-containing protein [Filomicrobium sp.]